MNTRSLCRSFVVLAGILAAAPAARAQWAVIDVQAVARLAQEVGVLQQELAAAQSELQQDRLTLQSMTGRRGMAQLLSGTQRNYLPPDWGTTAALASGTTGTYSALATTVQQLIAAHAILSPAALAALAPDERARLIANRNRIAIGQALFRAALSNASGRFAALQSLIDTIPAATDQKGILDLQARMTAEEAMLQDERAKLATLAGAMRAQAQAAHQQAREAIVANHGQFDTRFRPTP